MKENKRLYNECAKLNKSLSIEEMYFKSDPDYRVVLEHVSRDHGQEYINNTKSQFSDIFENNKDLIFSLVSQNDKYGKPIKHKYEDFGQVSPTNLRYVYQSLVILSHMKDNNINHANVIEIGGGYGGLCFYIHNLCQLFEISIDSYKIYDMPDVLELTEKYLRALDIEINKEEPKKDSFLISNYAFSELSEEIRKTYSDQVIKPFVSFGFMAWNFIDIYEDFCNCDIEIRSSTANGGVPSNKFLYLTPKKENK